MTQRAGLSLAIVTEVEANEDNFSEDYVTEDETWMYQFDLKNAIQSKEWHSKETVGLVLFKTEESITKLVATIFGEFRENYSNRFYRRTENY